MFSFSIVASVETLKTKQQKNQFRTKILPLSTLKNASPKAEYLFFSLWIESTNILEIFSNNFVVSNPIFRPILNQC